MTQGYSKWWGYIHINGSIHPKLFFGPLDLEEADESPFVKRVYEPFDAYGREDAIKIIKTKEDNRD